MADFIYGSEINLCIETMISNADDFLYLISPYIKLHDRIKDEMKKKRGNDKLQIVIVFGKNEDDKRKSLSIEDLSFLKEFPNITICYEKNLHAKYYASEDCSLITSMNLHQFSQNTNIEVGVQMFPKSLVGHLADSIRQSGSNCDRDSLDYFEGVIESSEKLFVKTPQYESSMFSKTYTTSIIDKLDEFFNQPKSDYKNVRPNSFNQFTKEPVPKNITSSFKPGYCIRTGAQILFNPERPFSAEAFKSWNKFKDPNYPEKYCHYSGEQSNGETSLGRPVMRKNWSKSKEVKS